MNIAWWYSFGHPQVVSYTSAADAAAAPARGTRSRRFWTRLGRGPSGPGVLDLAVSRSVVGQWDALRAERQDSDGRQYPGRRQPFMG